MTRKQMKMASRQKFLENYPLPGSQEQEEEEEEERKKVEASMPKLRWTAGDDPYILFRDEREAR